MTLAKDYDFNNLALHSFENPHKFNRITEKARIMEGKYKKGPSYVSQSGWKRQVATRTTLGPSTTDNVSISKLGKSLQTQGVPKSVRIRHR